MCKREESRFEESRIAIEHLVEAWVDAFYVRFATPSEMSRQSSNELRGNRGNLTYYNTDCVDKRELRIPLPIDFKVIFAPGTLHLET